MPTWDTPTWLLAQPGQSVQVTVPVANGGDQAAGPFNVRVYEIASEEPRIDQSQPVSFLAAFSEMNVRLSFVAPTAAGIYFLKFEVDADNQISEGNEENNASIGALIVGAFDNATIAGTWDMRGTDGVGTLTVNTTGRITSGRITAIFDEEAFTVNISGQANVAEDGAVGMDLVLSVAGQSETIALIGARNRAADVVAFTDADSDTDFLGLAVRRVGSYGPTDLNGTWHFIGRQGPIGRVVLGRGAITDGIVYDRAGELVGTVTGSASISSAGRITMQVQSNLPGDQGRQLVGDLNGSRNLAVLTLAGWPNNIEEENDGNQTGQLLVYRPMASLAGWIAAGDWYLVGPGLFGQLTLGADQQVHGNFIDGQKEQGRLLSIADSYWQIRATAQPERDGHLFVSLTMHDPYEGGWKTIDVIGWVVASGDIIVLTEQQPDVNDRSVVLLVRTGARQRLPDLVAQVGAISFPGAAAGATEPVLVPGDKFTVPVIIVNQSVETAQGRIGVRLWASEDAQIDEGDELLGSLSNISINLQPGASANVRITATIPQSLMGSFRIVAQVDFLDAIKESNEANNTAVAMVGDTAVTPAVQWVFGNVGSRRNVKLTVNDADGTAVTFSLSGPGMGEVSSLDGQWHLQFTDTTTTSAASITTKKSRTSGDDGLVHLARVLVGQGLGIPLSAIPTSGDGVASLKSLTGKTTRLSGDLCVTGWLGSLTLDDLSDALIRIEDAGGVGTPISLTFDEVRDTSLFSAVPIKSLTVRQWLDTDEEEDGIGPVDEEKGLWIGTLQSKGDFQAGLELDRNPAAGPALDKANIGGRLGPGIWHITGNAGAISALGTVESWSLDISGNLKSLTFKQNAQLNLYAGSVNTIKVTGNLSGWLSLENAEAALSLGSLTVGGRMEELRIWSAGNVGPVTAGAARNLYLVVGADEVLTSTGLAETADDFTGRFTLAGLTIRGIRNVTGQGTPAARGLYVSAWNIGSINISGLQTSNDGQLHGFAANRYRSWRLTDPSGRRIHAALNEPVEDFILREIKEEMPA